MTTEHKRRRIVMILEPWGGIYANHTRPLTDDGLSHLMDSTLSNMTTWQEVHNTEKNRRQIKNLLSMMEKNKEE